ERTDEFRIPRRRNDFGGVLSHSVKAGTLMRTRGLTVSVLACAAGLASCVSDTRRVRSTTMESPRVSAGVVAEREDAARLAEVFAQVEQRRREEAELRASIARRQPAVAVRMENAGVFGDPTIEELTDGHRSWPEAAGRTVGVGRLSDTEA